jgi:hypothetical protein
MSRPKLLKAPARVLLLTFVISARVAVAAPATTPQMAPVSGQSQHLATVTRPRMRHPLEEMDAYVLLHGVPRWGLNE